jgi:hypothetical protein
MCVFQASEETTHFVRQLDCEDDSADTSRDSNGRRDWIMPVDPILRIKQRIRPNFKNLLVFVIRRSLSRDLLSKESTGLQEFIKVEDRRHSRL